MCKAMYHNHDHLRLSGEPKECNNPFLHDFNTVLKSQQLQVLSEKTQLIPSSKNCNNRLSHSIDVCNVSSLIVDYLNISMKKNNISLINKDLVKAISLAHDIGHPPFGHTGERSLDTIMARKGGFESNAQTIKMLVNSQFNGTFRTLTSLLKHKRIIPEVREEYTGLIKGYYGYMATTLEPIFSLYQESVLEQGIVDIADTLSYVISDIKDLIEFFGKIKFSQLINAHFTNSVVFDEARHAFTNLSTTELRQLVLNTIRDINENVLKGLLKSNIKRKSMHEKSIINGFINNISIEINVQKPMYSKLKIPIQDQLKLFLLNQITRKCFLEREINLEIDRKIDNLMNRTFEYLFYLNTEVSMFPFEKQAVHKVVNTSSDIEKARYVCDLICHLSEKQIINLTNNLEEKIISI
ncbi:dGTP triphosphohydrolase [Peribacillus sp. NPDC096622]|uniref:dGTP triphosphohydrolase n=1 Tax=Peribacillus sp. NPDC096622 TaxID=3364396 RepID=UPI00381C31C2